MSFDDLDRPQEPGLIPYAEIKGDTLLVNSVSDRRYRERSELLNSEAGTENSIERDTAQATMMFRRQAVVAVVILGLSGGLAQVNLNNITVCIQ